MVTSPPQSRAPVHPSIGIGGRFGRWIGLTRGSGGGYGVTVFGSRRGDTVKLRQTRHSLPHSTPTICHLHAGRTSTAHRDNHHHKQRAHNRNLFQKNQPSSVTTRWRISIVDSTRAISPQADGGNLPWLVPNPSRRRFQLQKWSNTLKARSTATQNSVSCSWNMLSQLAHLDCVTSLSRPLGRQCQTAGPRIVAVMAHYYFSSCAFRGRGQA